MIVTPNMPLKVWNLLADLFDHGALADNWTTIAGHDHTSGNGVQIPTGGIANGAITSAKIASGAVGTAQLANGAVGTTQVADGSLTAVDLASNAGILDSQLASDVTVTSLPTVPYDGQTINLLVDATNGVVWRLRYRSASASIYKWEFVGGPALFSQVSTSENTTSTSFGALATAGPVVTLPTLSQGGEFFVSLGAGVTIITASGDTDDVAGSMSYKIGATAADVNDGVSLAVSYPSPFTRGSGSVSRTALKTFTGGTVLTSQYLVSASPGYTANFFGRFLSVTPRRLG